MYALQLGDAGGAGDWRPCWARVLENGSCEGLVGGNQGFLVLAPIGSGDGFDVFEAVLGFQFGAVDMFVEG